MFIRELISKNKRLYGVFSVVLVVVAGAAIVRQVANIRNDGPRPMNTKAFFTNDDGQTWFAEDAAKPTPFDHQGKPAVKVYVWRCGGGKPFITYMERINPTSKAKLDLLRSGKDVQLDDADDTKNPLGMPEESKSAMDGMASSKPSAKPNMPKGVIEFTLTRDTQVKKPGTGDSGWVKTESAEGRKVARTICPDGTLNDLEAVQPE